MKKFILTLFVLGSLVALPGVSLAQVQEDIDPDQMVAECIKLGNNLRRGDRDATKEGEVSVLQDFLQSERLLNSPPTGYFGIMTLKAVKEFQRKNGINPTGYVGSFTRAKIEFLTCGKTPIPTPPLPDTATLTIITKSPLPSATVGVEYKTIIKASGGKGSHFWTANTLPPGLFLSSSPATATCLTPPCREGAIIHGTPTAAGTYLFNAIVTDDMKASDRRLFMLVVGPVKTPPGLIVPVISGISGPQSLDVGQEGTWTVKASDASGGVLSYSVVWGDEAYAPDSSTALRLAPSTQQTATFTHIYQKAGAYNPVFTVTNSTGQSAKASLTVKVLEVPQISEVPPTRICTGPVTLYQHTNFGGYSAGFEPGSYMVGQLRDCGVQNDYVSSLKVKSGFKATLYEHDQLEGSALTKTGDDPTLVDDRTNDGLSWNDQMSSLKVETAPVVSPIDRIPTIPNQIGNISVNPERVTLKVRETAELQAIYQPPMSPCPTGLVCPQVMPKSYPVRAIWTSSNSRVATVAYKRKTCPLGTYCTLQYDYLTAVVTGISPGKEITITAIYRDPSGSVSRAVASVEVSAVVIPITLAEQKISLKGSNFSPKILSVPVGTKITWTNDDSMPHTVDSDTGAFASGTLNPGQAFPKTFDTTGTFPYFCQFHGSKNGIGMSGTITVTPAGSPTIPTSSVSANVLGALESTSTNEAESMSLPVVSVDTAVVPSCQFTASILRRGMNHPDVKCLQRLLNEKGFGVAGTEIGTETTYFGEGTLAALRAFQFAADLAVDGILGAESRAILTN